MAFERFVFRYNNAAAGKKKNPRISKISTLQEKEKTFSILSGSRFIIMITIDLEIIFTFRPFLLYFTILIKDEFQSLLGCLSFVA